MSIMFRGYIFIKYDYSAAMLCMIFIMIITDVGG
jgi:hypothetical protein